MYRYIFASRLWKKTGTTASLVSSPLPLATVPHYNDLLEDLPSRILLHLVKHSNRHKWSAATLPRGGHNVELAKRGWERLISEVKKQLWVTAKDHNISLHKSAVKHTSCRWQETTKEAAASLKDHWREHTALYLSWKKSLYHHEYIILLLRHGHRKNPVFAQRRLKRRADKE